MDRLVNSLVTRLNDLEPGRATQALLRVSAEVLHAHSPADHVVCYELVPDTGVPRLPAVYAGDFLTPEKSIPILDALSHVGMLSDFVRHWQSHYEEDTQSWVALAAKTTPPDYAHFIAQEQIHAFVFLPVSHLETKAAVIFLNQRAVRPYAGAEREILAAALSLVSAHLTRISLPQAAGERRKKRVAAAHTLYGSAAAQFRGEIETLEREISTLFDDDVPAGLRAHLESAKSTVFQVIRDLVINASDELLVDLRSMSLSKALTTTAAALQRAWPPSRQVVIDIPPIPAVIERQSLRLRQLLYTLILEVVGNAIKHGGPAPYINVDVSWADNCIYVQVIDHGRGFDLAERPFSRHGLGFWQHYVTEYLLGTFDVSSQPGFGTVVNAVIPVIPMRAEHDIQWI